MRKILVSECLISEQAVRYDGMVLRLSAPLFLRWKEEGRLVPICPELYGGLSVPRSPAQRVGGQVFDCDGKDVTTAFLKGAEEALRLAFLHNVAFAIMKEGSPSCGVRRIYDGTFTGRKICGQGVSTELLERHGFAVFSEHELDETAHFLSKLETETI